MIHLSGPISVARLWIILEFILHYVTFQVHSHSDIFCLCGVKKIRSIQVRRTTPSWSESNRWGLPSLPRLVTEMNQIEPAWISVSRGLKCYIVGHCSKCLFLASRYKTHTTIKTRAGLRHLWDNSWHALTWPDMAPAYPCWPGSACLQSRGVGWFLSEELGVHEVPPASHASVCFKAKSVIQVTLEARVWRIPVRI